MGGSGGGTGRGQEAALAGKKDGGGLPTQRGRRPASQPADFRRCLHSPGDPGMCARGWPCKTDPPTAVGGNRGPGRAGLATGHTTLPSPQAATHAAAGAAAVWPAPLQAGARRQAPGRAIPPTCITIPRYWLLRMNTFVPSCSTLAVASSWQFMMKLQGGRARAEDTVLCLLCAGVCMCEDVGGEVGRRQCANVAGR